MGKSVVVVGGGIIGMSVAWRLGQAGFSVTLFEKNTVGREASWAAAGMLSPGGEFEEDSEEARLAVESRDLYRDYVHELERVSGIEIDFQEAGALEPAYSETELAEHEARAERQKAIGIPSKRLTAEQIGTFWPRVRKEDLAGGYFYPGDALVDPRQVTAALRIACEKAGVTVLEQREVTHIDPAAQDAVVIAAGAWSGLISVNGVPQLPASEPVRGHMLGFNQPEQICNTIVRYNHTYLVQRKSGYFIVGATTENAGFDRALDVAALNALHQKAACVMPHLGETSPTNTWNGFRPASDKLHLGQWHSPRVYLAYGHYRNGILLAPVTARRLTNEISANLQKQ